MESNSRIKLNKLLFTALIFSFYCIFIFSVKQSLALEPYAFCTKNNCVCLTGAECTAAGGTKTGSVSDAINDDCQNATNTFNGYVCYDLPNPCTASKHFCVDAGKCTGPGATEINSKCVNTAQKCCTVQPAGATCESTDGTKKGKCQKDACSTGAEIAKASVKAPGCDTATPICCATEADKATCTEAAGTCKDPDKTTKKCPGEETEITNITTKCTPPQKCCKAAAANTAGDQSGAAGGTSNSGDIFSRIFNIFIACLTFSISLMIHLAAWLAGQIVVVLMEILVFISGYNSFIRNSYVSEGWRILRDLVNMFFVLGMLFIAFATVLKIEKYSWNKLLGKLLMMAVLVNFSKTICGIIIDFFQVLLMTFANAYKDITAGNIFSGLGMVDWFKVQSQAVAGNVSAGVQLGMIASAFLGLILAIVSMIVIFIFCVILIVRIVGLWVLVTFSPLAFFAYTFEGTKGLGTISSTWWKEFLEYCMVGPFVGFILWISVATLPKLDVNQMIPGSWYDTSKREGLQVTFSEAGSMDRILKYMMSIVTMIVGLGYAKKFSIVGASALSGVADKFKDQTIGRAQRMGKSVGETVSAPVRGAMKSVGDSMNDNKYLRYLTTEGRKQAAQLSEASARGKFGPRTGDLERVMQQVSEGDVKRLDAQQAFISPKAFGGKLQEAFDKGDYRNARALMSEGAKKGWINSKNIDDFKDKFKDKMGDKAHFEFTEQLGKDYKNATGVHLRTNDEYISPEGNVLPKEDAKAEYRDSVGRMSTSQQSDMAENKKVFHEKDKDGNMVNKNWKAELLGFHGSEQNSGRWTQNARNNIASNIEDIRKDPDKMKQFSKEELQDLNVLYEACTAEYEGYNRAKDKDGNKSKGKVAFDRPELIRDAQRGLDLTGAAGYTRADIDGAIPIEDDTMNNLDTPKPQTLPTAMPGAKAAQPGLVKSALEKIKSKDWVDDKLEKFGKPGTRTAEAASRFGRQVLQFVRKKPITGGEYVPPEAKVIGGNDEVSATEVNSIINDESTKADGVLNFNDKNGNSRMTKDGFNTADRANALKELTAQLERKGVSPQAAANKAGQMVRYKEDQYKHEQGTDAVHQDVIFNIGIVDAKTGKGTLPKDLKNIQPPIAGQPPKQVDKADIDKAIHEINSVFAKYKAELEKRGAILDEAAVTQVQASLTDMRNLSRSAKSFSDAEKTTMTDNLNLTVAAMWDGVLLKKNK